MHLFLRIAVAVPEHGPIPFRVTQMGVQLESELALEDVVDPFEHVRPVLERVERGEGRLLGATETSGGIPVALPRLRLYYHVVRPVGEARQQRSQAVVPVIQVDPHGGREAEDGVEALPDASLQVAGPRGVAFGRLRHDVERLELDQMGKVRARHLACPLN